jgi:hypothetical protein
MNPGAMTSNPPMSSFVGAIGHTTEDEMETGIAESEVEALAG